MNLLIYTLLCTLWSATGFAGPAIISPDQFHVGSTWVWSYAEWDEASGGFLSPYLYERYEVVSIDDTGVTISMASSADASEQGSPHHKFLVNLEDCLIKGRSLHFPKNFRLQFFTKSLSNQWELVSKNHSPLAFTEKFNCRSGRAPIHYDMTSYQDWPVPIFQWSDLSPDSWYARAQALNGVMVKRNARRVLVKLFYVNDWQDPGEPVAGAH